MSKTLTEQWREGTLRGCFYWKLQNGNICIAYTDTMRDIKNVRDSDEVEVLQEAPSYVEYKRLQEQINEANECIKDEYLWTCSACSLVGSCMSCGNRYFGRYIKKWGVE